MIQQDYKQSSPYTDIIAKEDKGIRFRLKKPATTKRSASLCKSKISSNIKGLKRRTTPVKRIDDYNGSALLDHVYNVIVPSYIAHELQRLDKQQNSEKNVQVSEYGRDAAPEELQNTDIIAKEDKEIRLRLRKPATTKRSASLCKSKISSNIKGLKRCTTPVKRIDDYNGSALLDHVYNVIVPSYIAHELQRLDKQQNSEKNVQVSEYGRDAAPEELQKHWNTPPSLRIKLFRFFKIGCWTTKKFKSPFLKSRHWDIRRAQPLRINGSILPRLQTNKFESKTPIKESRIGFQSVYPSDMGYVLLTAYSVAKSSWHKSNYQTFKQVLPKDTKHTSPAIHEQFASNKEYSKCLIVFNTAIVRHYSALCFYNTTKMERPGLKHWRETKGKPVMPMVVPLVNLGGSSWFHKLIHSFPKLSQLNLSAAPVTIYHTTSLLDTRVVNQAPAIVIEHAPASPFEITRIARIEKKRKLSRHPSKK